MRRDKAWLTYRRIALNRLWRRTDNSLKNEFTIPTNDLNLVQNSLEHLNERKLQSFRVYPFLKFLIISNKSKNAVRYLWNKTFLNWNIPFSINSFFCRLISPIYLSVIACQTVILQQERYQLDHSSDTVFHLHYCLKNTVLCSRKYLFYLLNGSVSNEVC